MCIFAVDFERNHMKKIFLLILISFAVIQSSYCQSSWSGTGFAIGNKYVVTNFHVVEDATTILVNVSRNNVSRQYSAEVVATDKVNDIAVIKVSDSDFKGFGAIPYGVTTRVADVGEDVFVLGWPLGILLGDEVKLTTGVVNSRTGMIGWENCYQIQAPITSGNSGGPVFDNKGNVIGIVVGGLNKELNLAENVGYAIKTAYLKILIENADLNIPLPSNNIIANLSRPEKVKRIKNFVCYIECSDSYIAKPVVQGYVDLGLPSGTLWKEENESGYYTYDEAAKTFGGELPSKQQWEELKDRCSWVWSNNGYKVTGPNCKSIFLPAAGGRNGMEVYVGGTNGFYWSSTYGSENGAWYMYFNGDDLYVNYGGRYYGRSVRLVKD